MNSQNQPITAPEPLSLMERIHIRAADYFLARGGREDSDVISHEENCECAECKLLSAAYDDAEVALNFEARELSA